MKIELKKFTFNERLSHETNAFAADLYINDKKAGHCENAGHGGPTDYRHYDEAGKTLIEQAEEYCKSLPPHESSFGGEPLDMDLEFYIDLLVDEEIKKKDEQKTQKKLERMFPYALIFSNGTEYIPIQYGKKSEKIPLTSIKPENLKRDVAAMKAKYEPQGLRLINNNINPDGTLKP